MSNFHRSIGEAVVGALVLGISAAASADPVSSTLYYTTFGGGTNVWTSTFSYDAIHAWFADKGDQTLRVAFTDLNATSTVFDLGGYQGDWTAEIDARYLAKSYVFEPIRQFHEQICTRFQANPRVKPCHFGLGAKDEQIALSHSADGTGAFATGASQETVTVVGIQDFMASEGIAGVDLIKINIEGGEFDLLEHLTATGAITAFRRVQVQFHDFVPDAIARRARIVNALSRTHKQMWCYYFVWEEWERIDAGQG